MTRKVRRSSNKVIHMYKMQKLLGLFASSAFLLSCSTVTDGVGGVSENQVSTTTSTTISTTTSTVQALKDQVPSALDTPDLLFTSYEGWSYKLKMNFSGLDLRFGKVISDSPPGRAQMSVALDVPVSFPGFIVANPSGNPGRNIPPAIAESYVVVNDVENSELTANYGNSFKGPCSTYTGDALPDFVRSDSHRLFCGDIGFGGISPSDFQSTGTTDEVSESDVDKFINRFGSLPIDIWIFVGGCLVVFSKGKQPFTVGNPWNGPNSCAITTL
jgi:hypothetical protein